MDLSLVCLASPCTVQLNLLLMVHTYYCDGSTGLNIWQQMIRYICIHIPDLQRFLNCRETANAGVYLNLASYLFELNSYIVMISHKSLNINIKHGNF